MKITGPQVISEIRDKLQFEVGRHLYGVLGTYTQLSDFEEIALSQALDPRGRRFPKPVNLNRELLARIGDEDLRGLVQAEARRPQAIQRRLGQELDKLLEDILQDHPFQILKHLELMFAYGLDFGVFRTRATNQNHILLLLPGARHGDHVALFREVDARFQRAFPSNLIADNHLWELKDG
jgi:hypothetical protein